jgi:hypothetical protein
VLDCSPLEWEALERLPPADSFPPGAPPVWLALDEVQDPVSCANQVPVYLQGLAHRAFAFLGQVAAASDCGGSTQRERRQAQPDCIRVQCNCAVSHAEMPPTVCTPHPLHSVLLLPNCLERCGADELWGGAALRALSGRVRHTGLQPQCCTAQPSRQQGIRWGTGGELLDTCTTKNAI